MQNNQEQVSTNEPFINQADVLATMQKLRCNWDYAVAFENGLLQSRYLEAQSGKPAFGKEQLLKAIQKMDNCHPEIAARALRVMQHASIGFDEIDFSQVPKTIESIGCNPEEAVSVMHNLKSWGHIPNRPLSDVKILNQLFPNRDLKYALNLFKFIENYQAGRIAEETWNDLADELASDISEFQANAMEESGDVTASSMLTSIPNVEYGKNDIEELIATLDKIGMETRRQETKRVDDENMASKMAKMAISPMESQNPDAKIKKKNDKGGLYSKSRSGFLLTPDKKKSPSATENTAAESQKTASAPNKIKGQKGHQKPQSSSKKKGGKKRSNRLKARKCK